MEGELKKLRVGYCKRETMNEVEYYQPFVFIVVRSNKSQKHVIDLFLNARVSHMYLSMGASKCTQN